MGRNDLELSTQLIAQFEGYASAQPDGSCKAYLDCIGVPTIGYGTASKDIRLGLWWTEAKARQRMQKDILEFQAKILAISPILQDDPKRLAAITSFAYNVGVENYKISGVRKCIDKADWTGAQQQLLRWSFAGGRKLKALLRRRQMEGIFLGG